MSATNNINLRRYARLVAKAAPVVVRNEADNRRLLAAVERLMAKGEQRLTPEEEALLELLSRLIEEYESHAYPAPKSSPREMVAFLLEQRGMQAPDLWPVIGSKGRVSDLLSGKRAVSKGQAKKLAEFFGVGVGVFV